MSEEVLICRCQEVTEQEILDAIRDGATTVDGVKRRARARPAAVWSSAWSRGRPARIRRMSNRRKAACRCAR